MALNLLMKLAIGLGLLLALPEESEHCLPLRQDWLVRIAGEGRPEVSRYRSKPVVEGRRQDQETVIIVTRGEVGRFSRVIVSNPDGVEPTIPALKLRMLEIAPTDGFPQNLAVTVFVRRDRPMVLIKESVSSMSAEGSTFQQVNHLGQAWQHWWDSYHEGEGHGRRILSTHPLTEEQLLIALRAVQWSPGLECTVPLIWGLRGDRIRGVSAPLPSRIHCRGREKVVVPAGEFDCWLIEVVTQPASGESRRSLFRIADRYPSALVEYVGSEGRVLQLFDVR